MERLLSYRGVILKALESLRADKVIGNSLQAMVELALPPEEGMTDSETALLLEMVLAADIHVVSGGSGDIVARAYATEWNRCDRCWRYTRDVGANTAHPDLCPRCIEVLHILGG